MSMASKKGAKRRARNSNIKSVKKITEEGRFLLALETQVGMEFALARKGPFSLHDWINVQAWSRDVVWEYVR